MAGDFHVTDVTGENDAVFCAGKNATESLQVLGEAVAGTRRGIRSTGSKAP